jgi:cell division septation protein DedD
MEGKKVLWVVFSIALALVVILAAGLFLLRPRQPKGSETPLTGTPSLQGYDPFEYVRGTSVPPGLSTPPAEPQPNVIVVGEPPPPEQAPQEQAGAQTPLVQPAAPSPGRASGLPQSPVAARGLTSGRPAAPQGQPTPEQGPLVAAAPTAGQKPALAVKPAVPPPQAAQTAAAALQKRAGAAAPQKRSSAPSSRSSAPPRPKAVSVTEYWIQAGSFSSAARADEVSRRLEEKGLAPRTTTRDLNGKTHFRVRVGPYANRAEAEKFLGWIRELKGFETSYISMVASRRLMP